MSGLIAINYEKDQPTVSAREIHRFLEVETPFHKWFPRMCEYGFDKSIDFLVVDIFVRNPDGSIRVTKTPKVTGKGQQYFINLFLSKTQMTG